MTRSQCRLTIYSRARSVYIQRHVSFQRGQGFKQPTYRKIERVCVPIKVEDCENFDPLGVPTLSQLAKELDEYDQKHKDNTERKIPGMYMDSNREVGGDFNMILLRRLQENFSATVH